jgi:hypothetical protein
MVKETRIMTIIRTSVACALALSLSTTAFAGGLRESAEQAAAEGAQTQQMAPMPSGKTLVYTGSAVFAAGMATALYGFMRAGNGEYTQFGEATSRNKQLGAAGIAAAFTGGTMMFLGSRGSRFLPSTVSISQDGASVGKMVSW